MSAHDAVALEQASLISRGVRPMALLGSVDRDKKVMADTFIRLWTVAAKYQGNVLPFVVPRKGMNDAMTGFAAEPWVIDLLAWAYNQPERQYHQIVGLLLGYSAQAIAKHDRICYAGDPSIRPKSKSQTHYNTDKA